MEGLKALLGWSGGEISSTREKKVRRFARLLGSEKKSGMGLKA